MGKEYGELIEGETGIHQVTDGFRVRVQMMDPRTGKPAEKERVIRNRKRRKHGLPAWTINDARALFRKLNESLAKEIAGELVEAVGDMRFETFSERRITLGLKAGTISVSSARKRLPAQLIHVYAKWGPIFLDKISWGAVKEWNALLCQIARGDVRPGGRTYAAETVRGWWAAFCAVMREAERTYKLPSVVENHEEIPTGPGKRTGSNSLEIEGELPRFMASAWKLFPSLALRYSLGILTSRRPCEILPLRGQGPKSDFDSRTGILQIRRSQVDGTIRENTKTGDSTNIHHFTIGLPPTLAALLDAHAAEQPGDLLFPDAAASDRKALVAICRDAGITTKLTPYFMRRTFHDLARRAGGLDIVVGSMGGHPLSPIPGLNRKTQNAIYATVRPDEQRALIERMAQLGRIFEATGLAARGVGAAHAEGSDAFVRALEEAA